MFDGDFVGREMDRQAKEARMRKQLTMTETSRRIRAAARLVREARHYPTNWRTEVGARTIPVYADTEFEAKTMAFPKGDDLDSFGSIEGHDEQARFDGYIVHLYFSSNGEYGELEDVVTVWTGTATIPPVIIH